MTELAKMKQKHDLRLQIQFIDATKLGKLTFYFINFHPPAALSLVILLLLRHAAII